VRPAGVVATRRLDQHVMRKVKVRARANRQKHHEETAGYDRELNQRSPAFTRFVDSSLTHNQFQRSRMFSDHISHGNGGSEREIKRKRGDSC